MNVWRFFTLISILIFDISFSIRYIFLCPIFFAAVQGNIYVQDGIDWSTMRTVYDKSTHGDGSGGAIDPQMSPDGRLVAFVRDGEIFVASGKSFLPGRRRLKLLGSISRPFLSVVFDEWGYCCCCVTFTYNSSHAGLRLFVGSVVGDID